MTQHARNPSRRCTLPPNRVAIILLGQALIQYRINRDPQQLCRLNAMAEMAIALGALSPCDWQQTMGGV